MPSIQRIQRIRGNVRWNRELEVYEMYCQDCVTAAHPGANFWPLTDEFWYNHNLARCRACNRKKDADRIARRRRTDEAFRKASVKKSRELRGFQERK